MYKLARNDQAIDAVMNKCWEAEESGSKVPGMTYEAGVRAAIEWITGDTDDNPMDLD